MLFPTSIANSLIAVGTDGLQERDRMVRAAIAIVCELGQYLAFVRSPKEVVILRDNTVAKVKYLICYEDILKASNIYCN